jgi:hypothetical protein
MDAHGRAIRGRHVHRQLAVDMAVRKLLQDMWLRPKRRLHRHIAR